MTRKMLSARPHWQNIVERDGLSWHTEGELPSWNESAVYVFTAAEIEQVQRTAREIHGLYLRAADHAVKHSLWSRLGLRSEDAPVLRKSWEQQDWSLHGRFDFLLDAHGQLRLLEYNAETALSLVETALIQHRWQIEVMPEMAQFNRLHERLVEAWRCSGFRHVHCAWRPRHPEVEGTVRYMAGIVREAGLKATLLALHRLGWHRGQQCFVDCDGTALECCYKLYPWEWMLQEPFAGHLDHAGCRFVEPAWKLLLGSKAMLALLWELFPDHPALLPCAEEPSALGASFVSKPFFGREGYNISIFQDGALTGSTSGEYSEERKLFQALVRSPRHDGHLAQLGIWMVESEPAALGIRESTDAIITNNSPFVPHVVQVG